MMKKALLVMTGLTMAAGAATAADPGATSKQEAIGVGSGAVIGAAAGGPVGFLVGAAVGGWLGDQFHQEREAGEALSQRLNEVDDRASRLDAELQRTRHGLAQAELARQADRLAMTRTLEQAINVQLLFKTGQSELDADGQIRLERLAGLLAEMDGVTIEVAGHADARGDEEYNAQLSAERAVAVRDALIRSGIDSDRISTAAMGEQESTAGEGDLDGYALERRVDIRLLLTPAGQLAQGR
jgi:outer membrane protein OmpA-like peptidoglycan-associated protein